MSSIETSENLEDEYKNFEWLNADSSKGRQRKKVYYSGFSVRYRNRVIIVQVGDDVVLNSDEASHYKWVARCKSFWECKVTGIRNVDIVWFLRLSDLPQSVLNHAVKRLKVSESELIFSSNGDTQDLRTIVCKAVITSVAKADAKPNELSKAEKSNIFNCRFYFDGVKHVFKPFTPDSSLSSETSPQFDERVVDKVSQTAPAGRSSALGLQYCNDASGKMPSQLYLSHRCRGPVPEVSKTREGRKYQVHFPTAFEDDTTDSTALSSRLVWSDATANHSSLDRAVLQRYLSQQRLALIFRKGSFVQVRLPPVQSLETETDFASTTFEIVIEKIPPKALSTLDVPIAQMVLCDVGLMPMRAASEPKPALLPPPSTLGAPRGCNRPRLCTVVGPPRWRLGEQALVVFDGQQVSSFLPGRIFV